MRYNRSMQVLRLPPFGYCAGVERAFSLAKQAREEHPAAPIYLVGSLIHNELAMKPLLEDGFILLDERDGDLCEQMEQLPDGAIVVYSAHGHDKISYDAIAERKHFVVYDATCKYIIDNIYKIDSFTNKILFYCQSNHLEAVAVRGRENVIIIDPNDPRFPPLEGPIGFLRQSSAEEAASDAALLEAKRVYGDVADLDGRCPSTKLRQANVIGAPTDIDLFVIVGSKDSANANRLAKLAKDSHPKADVVLVLNREELKGMNLVRYKKAAIVSAASSSAETSEDIYEYLKEI